MSLTARERRNPPPRRKSCAACTKAKRRCDFAVPACLRCSQRRIACQYPLRTPRGQAAAQPDSPETIMPSLLTNDSASSTPSPVVGVEEPTADDFNTIIAAIDTSFDDLEGFDVPMDDTALELIQQPMALAPPSTKDFGLIPESIANRLQWSTDEIQKAPSNMVLENQTPWCHSQLYKNEMPRSMQGMALNFSHCLVPSTKAGPDAHAACALYLAKNRVNSPIIFRSIESRVNDLLSAPPPITPLDCVAHTQALILYQIIRLFDGDVSARASAERMIPAIEASAMSLFSHAQFDLDGASSSLPLFPIAPTKTFWMDWILQESIRRTLLFSFYFVQIYRIMANYKGLHCDGRLGLCHSWTLSAHLWHASTPLEFAEAWKNKKHFVITNAVFGEVLQDAMAEDIDRFGRILISSLMGAEEAEGWFASRGGTL
ncbi:C6 finger domain-containing [Fusarium albosuccineum]|uniref:C6 finger domain-containing n=1 Tax=Fusarium albosuccineum TaxID=1237068 RepID=A0A8H4LM36_9HYPO|nr:C6 finger domain-containing [Fusarium albosuccineum]